MAKNIAFNLSKKILLKLFKETSSLTDISLQTELRQYWYINFDQKIAYLEKT